MNDLERRIIEALWRMNAFGIENAAAIALFAMAAAAFARIQTAVTRLEELGIARSSSGDAKLSRTAQRKMWRAEVYNALALMAKSAADIARRNVNFVNKYLLPHANRSDLTWLETARAFAADWVADKDFFIEYAIDADFIGELTEDTDALEEAMSGQDASKRDRIEANADIDDILDEALKDVRTLKIVVPNIFRGQPGKLADWASASHIEKAAKRTPNNPPQS